MEEVNQVLLRPATSHILSGSKLSASLMHGMNNAPYKAVRSDCYG